MELSKEKSRGIVLSAAALTGLLLVFTNVALAQQRYPIEEKPEWSTGKYIQQHAIEVGDVPGHKVRILELHYVYNEKSEFAVSGVKVKEAWVRAYTDYTNGKGRSWGYGQWVLADGSKVFLESSGTTLAEPTATGSIRGSYHGVSRLTGGTGKYSRIRGTIAEINDFDSDPKTGYNRSESKGEYWFEE